VSVQCAEQLEVTGHFKISESIYKLIKHVLCTKTHYYEYAQNAKQILETTQNQLIFQTPSYRIKINGVKNAKLTQLNFLRVLLPRLKATQI
jgi:hypothetical protein